MRYKLAMNDDTEPAPPMEQDDWEEDTAVESPRPLSEPGPKKRSGEYKLELGQTDP